MIISFAGHSNLSNPHKIKELLHSKLSDLLDSVEFASFYCGGYGDFDNLCAEVLFELKAIHKNFETLLILPYPPAEKQFFLPSRYDDSIYPPLEKTPKSLAILKRNEWMVDHSDLIIACVLYTFGGAYKTIQYAKKRNKTIVNLALPRNDR